MYFSSRNPPQLLREEDREKDVYVLTGKHEQECLFFCFLPPHSFEQVENFKKIIIFTSQSVLFM
jgi:hypothetical protein